MILYDVSLYGAEGQYHLHICDGSIKAITEDRDTFANIQDELRFELKGNLVLPGWINSHEHLDFNLFPQIGNRVYNNYTEWGADIHANNRELIEAVKRIPAQLRIQWGMYKNLLNGFTTVVNHGRQLDISPSFMQVYQQCRSLHSPSFEKKWIWKLNSPFVRKSPVVMHIGEGTDEFAANEVGKVIRNNLFRKRIIAIHGVAMKETAASSFAGLIWCPASNKFLLNRTAPVEQLKKKTTVVFGTDSTLTASWNCWQHFREAMAATTIKESELVKMLTSSPAVLWNMAERGQIAEGKRADLLLVKTETPLFENNPEDISMIIQDGEIRLIDETFSACYKARGKMFTRIQYSSNRKWVEGDLAKLTSEIVACFPEAYLPFIIDHGASL